MQQDIKRHSVVISCQLVPPPHRQSVEAEEEIAIH